MKRDARSGWHVSCEVYVFRAVLICFVRGLYVSCEVYIFRARIFYVRDVNSFLCTWNGIAASVSRE